MAVEAKMRAEGLDPDLLEWVFSEGYFPVQLNDQVSTCSNPDAPVPDAGQAPDDESDNESQSLSSGDDFSDW